MSKEIITGTYRAAGKDHGFLIPEGAAARSEDCFVPPHKNGGAWDGDQVEAAVIGQDLLHPGRPCAQVTRVLVRNNKVVTGTLVRLGREFWLRPDNDRLPAVKINGGKLRPRAGNKIAAAVTHFGSGQLPPLGATRADFGPAASRQAGVEAILFGQDIHRDFPPDALAQARATEQAVPADALKGRLDLREKAIITIDGAASKDLDDAISLEKDSEGNWLLGVHIADVSHYVAPGSALDAAAFDRGTSVYFADQVVPMLPVELSNGICSLNPGVDRLTLTCVMTFSPAGELLTHAISPSVIRSKERMTYHDCNALLAGTDPALEGRYAAILPMLRDMVALSAILQKRRRARGGLDLETQESYILCNGQGEPVDVAARRQGVSEKLIEDFMLAANETVAKHLLDLHWPGVYRVHEKPTEEKVESLRAMLAPLGFSLRDGSSHSYQKAIDAFRDTPKAPAVSMMVLRSLMKARYAAENLGHFGLAAKYYCHFTSPIRRYPDLMVHRCLHALWEETEQNATRRKRLAAACGKAAGQSSQRELAAQTAEREIDKLYFAEYMAGHIGEEFDANLSGVTKFGLFAALPNGVEGLIPTETLPQDRYAYDELHMSLVGERTGNLYTFGMTLRVVCVSADPATGRVEFRLPGREEAPAKPRRDSRPLHPREHRSGGGPKSNRRCVHVPKRGRKGKRR